MTDIPQTLEQLVSMLKISMNTPVQSATDHDPVTLAAGSDPALTLAGQELHLVDIITAVEFGAHLVPNAHHDPVTVAGLGLSLNGQEVTLTSSSNPGAAPAIVATDENGGATFAQLGIGAITSHLVAEQTDTYDVGTEDKFWRRVFASEMETVLFAENTAALIGGRFLIPHGSGTLAADVGTGDASVDFGQTMTAGDIIELRGRDASFVAKAEYMTVGSLVSGTRYNVTRNVDGSGVNTWSQGQAYAIRGTSGDGAIELDAQTAGPRIRILEQGATYNALTEPGRIGDMAGWKSGLSGMGIGIGNPNGTHMRYTSAEGWVVETAGGNVSIDDDGIVLAQGADTDYEAQIKWSDGIGGYAARIAALTSGGMLVRAEDFLVLQTPDGTVQINNGKLLSTIPFECSNTGRFYGNLYIGTADTFLTRSGNDLLWWDGSAYQHATGYPGWSTFSYLNSWTNYGTDGFSNGGYFKDGHGVVHLRGLIKNGTNGHIATLPTGYRPAGNEIFPAITWSSVFARITVYSDGRIIATNYSSTWLSLAGITFKTL